MEDKKKISEEIRRGREAAIALLVIEICLCGERLASVLGIRKWFDQIWIARYILTVLLILYYYVIKKPRLVDTPQWYILLAKDKVIWLLSIIASLILLSSIGV